MGDFSSPKLCPPLIFLLVALSMEVGDKLKDLNMTADEIDRLTKAFKDEKFREMLRDYAQELSDPENKKRYEEEIQLLEQERGNTIEFIHPEPFKALRTSADGKHKCFINICASEKVGKPESKWGLSEEGRRGQCWSLPHSLHPGRQDTDPKGNKIMIYDVIFHPDTLHIASKNKRFMDMVDSTAIQGVQSAFKVTLDKNNVREMRAKYKGTPQPCVIRKPIPGYQPTSEKTEDPLAFPYPDDKRPTTSSQTKPTESTKNSDAKPKSFQVQVQPQNTKEPTTPNYTVKYRSFIDLQDFRCSRDSSKSPRPKEIVVTVDMPLLKAASDASLEVKEKKLLLESKKPAYRLELPLAYPVDEDEGEAKFNKQRGQLTVTLPVLPSNEAFDFAVGPAEEEKSEVEEEDKWKETENQKSEEEEEEEQRGVEKEEEDLKQQTRVEKGEEMGEEQMREGQESAGQERVAGEEEKLGKHEREEETGVEEEAKWKKQIRKGQDSEEEEEEEEEKLKEQRLENEDRLISELREDGRDRAAEKKDSGVTSVQCDAVDQSLSAEEETPKMKTADSEEENGNEKVR